jgi:hypothetical protein
MSDNSDSEIPVKSSEIPVKSEIVKPKKQLSESKLAQLASARAKALEKKKLLKDIADKEKNDRIKRVKAYDDLKNKAISKKELKVVESDSSYTESESESSSDIFLF